MRFATEWVALSRSRACSALWDGTTIRRWTTPGSVDAVLTDYHLHLRADDLDAAAEEHFTEESGDHYLAAAEEHGIAELGVSEHVYRFSQALDVWDHAFWREQARDDLDAYAECGGAAPLRLG